MATTEVIRASISEAILDKTDRLFRNDDRSLWVELLQNARRAGATLIQVSIEESAPNAEECVVAISDDGHGIDDFQRLLTLGGSGWDDETQQKEDPAGMGFFALCRSEIDVHSGNRFVNLSPSVFRGQTEAKVQESGEWISGTRIRFTRASRRQALAEALEYVTEFFPVEVHLGQRVLPRHDFLEGALHREIIDGIEVGFATEFTWRADHGLRENWNFYGACIKGAVDSIPGVVSGNLCDETHSLHARFNVLETGRVKLQLPDRRAIVEDEFLKQFLQKTRAAAYRCIQNQPAHLLPYKNWREAQDLGVDLPEAACVLESWHAEPADTYSHEIFGEPERGLHEEITDEMLVSGWLENRHTLEGAMECGAFLDEPLYKENRNFAGYKWYDRLPMIVDSSVFVDGKRYTEWREAESGRPEKIEIEVSIVQAGCETIRRLPAMIHVECESTGLPEFVAVKNSPWDNDEMAGPFSVVDFMIWATFSASDDFGDSDSWDTQVEAFAKEIRRDVNHYFRGPKATLAAILKDAVDVDANRLAKELGVCEIRLRRKGPGRQEWSVELVQDDAAA